MVNENSIRLEKYGKLTEELVKVKDLEKQIITIRNSLEEINCKLGDEDKKKALEFNKSLFESLFEFQSFLNDLEAKYLTQKNDVWWELQTEFHK